MHPMYDEDLTEGMTDAERAEISQMEAIEGYCDSCEVAGHTFRTCPQRDDDSLFEGACD